MRKWNCEDVRERIERNIKEIAELETVLRRLPEGELLCKKNGTRYKWFLKQNGISSYLPKRNQKLAEKLALKQYCTLRIKELSTDISVQEYYLRKMEGVEGKAESLLYHQEWGKLLEPFFKPKDLELKRWQDEDYERNTKYGETLIFKGTGGKMLRSKSEVIIDMLLYENHIPFRYESKLVLGGIEMYPDFTVRHPVTGEIFYWEHFGLMDEEGYRNNACSKLRLYCENGIVPSINLITTYETKAHPLDIGHVKSIIEEHFLS